MPVWDRSGVLLELLFASFSLCVAVLQEGMHLRLVLAWLSDSNVQKREIIFQLMGGECMRGYGATAARLTPDQKVGSSNLSALTYAVALLRDLADAPRWRDRLAQTLSSLVLMCD